MHRCEPELQPRATVPDIEKSLLDCNPDLEHGIMTTPSLDRTVDPHSPLKEILGHLTEAATVDDLLHKLPPLLCSGCGFDRALLYMPDGRGSYRIRERHPIVPADAPEVLPTSALQGIGTVSLSPPSTPLAAQHPLSETFGRTQLIAGFLPGEPFLGASPLLVADLSIAGRTLEPRHEDLFAALLLVAALRSNELLLAREVERLREEVGRDFLTRLANRQMLMEMFEREMARAKRKQTP